MPKTNPNPKNLSREQISAGLDQFKAWYPEEANKIDKYRDILLDYFVDGVQIPENHPIRSEKHEKRLRQFEENVSATPCGTALTEAVVEGAVFLATVGGMVTAERFSKGINRYVLSMFFKTDKYVKDITPVLEAFNAADGKLGKAKAFAPLANKLWQVGIVQAAFDIIKDGSTYFDWLIDGAIAIAQIVVWVASEFIAAIAEFAIVVLSAAHLLRTSVNAVRVCRA